MNSALVKQLCMIFFIYFVKMTTYPFQPTELPNLSRPLNTNTNTNNNNNTNTNTNNNTNNTNNNSTNSDNSSIFDNKLFIIGGGILLLIMLFK